MLVVSTLAAYAFARMQLRAARTSSSATFLATLMIPSEVTLIPNFVIITRWLGWYDTYQAQIVPVPGQRLRHLPPAPVLPHHPQGPGGRRQDRRLLAPALPVGRHRPPLRPGPDHPGAAELPVRLERLPVAPARHPQPGDAPHPARAAGVLVRARRPLRRADGGDSTVVILPTVVALLAGPALLRGGDRPHRPEGIGSRTQGDRRVRVRRRVEKRRFRWQSHGAASSPAWPPAGPAPPCSPPAARARAPAPARAPPRSSSASRSASPSGTPRPASTPRRWTRWCAKFNAGQRQEHHPQERVPGQLHPGLPEDHGRHSGRPAPGRGRGLREHGRRVHEGQRRGRPGPLRAQGAPGLLQGEPGRHLPRLHREQQATPQFNSKLLSFPFTKSLAVNYYNEDLLKAAGVQKYGQAGG